MSEKLLQTPLHSRHLSLRARMVPFAGYEMPVQYTGVLEETRAVRAAMGLFDVSHMGQFSLKGKNTLASLQRLVTNDLKRLVPGQAQYNMLCNEKGGVIDDLIVYRRSDEETYICVNASNRGEDFDWMKKHLTGDVSLTDESDETALIALQGPKSDGLLARYLDPRLLGGLGYYTAVDAKIFGRNVYLSRTGYTGEDGFELYVANKDAGEIWDRLLEEGRSEGLIACGLGSRDTLRLEMGYPLHGHELSPEISPLSAGLGWVVKLQAGNDFIGKSALVDEAKAGPKKVLKGFTVQDRRIARQGYKIVMADGQLAGTITSGTHSPHVNAPVAMGFVDKHLKDQTEFFVEVREARIPMKITSLPFVKPQIKKK